MRARAGSSACSPPTACSPPDGSRRRTIPPTRVLWATGSVRPVDLTVGAVSHVPEKIANSLDRLKQARAAGRRVLLALPAANAAEVPPTLAGELAALGIETVALAHVQPLFDALAMKLPDSLGKGPVKTPGAAPR